MTLDEALNACPTEEYYLARLSWVIDGMNIQLLTSAKTFNELNIDLKPESLMADDWKIYKIHKEGTL